MQQRRVIQAAVVACSLAATALSAQADKGNAIGATHAVLRSDDQDLDRKPVGKDAKEVSFVTELKKGSHRLAPVFEIKEGELGAYYVVVTRLD